MLKKDVFISLFLWIIYILKRYVLEYDDKENAQMVTLLCSNIKTNKLFASIYFKINHKNVCIKKLATRAISAGYLASLLYKYLSVRRSHHVRRESLKIPTLI